MSIRSALWTVPLFASALSAQQLTPEMAQVATAYAAKVTASAIFVSGRTLESVLEQEFAPTSPIEKMMRLVLKFDVDRDAGTVTCSIGKTRSTAVFRGPLGCALTLDADVDELRQAGQAVAASLAEANAERRRDRDALWPEGERVAGAAATGIDHDVLAKALDAAMAEPHDDKSVHTRAVVVVHDGRIVGERYADGISEDSALPGWSMTKTITNALLGMRIGDGVIELAHEPRVPGWGRGRGRGRPRPRIGYEHLLTMTAGLEWNESYEDPDGDVLRMLFRSADHAGVYAKKRPAAAPGTRFQYASGASNLLCRLVRGSYQQDLDYWLLPQRLFTALGMHTAVLETDPNGTFVGSSYGYASARDWARFGLLYLQDGVFFGERVLPEGWVKQSTTAHPASNGRYGFQIWLNQDPDGDGEQQRHWPDLPADLFHMDGHEGQYCVVSPAARLVIVRLGCTKQGGFDLRALLRDVHRAVGS